MYYVFSPIFKDSKFPVSCTDSGIIEKNGINLLRLIMLTIFRISGRVQLRGRYIPLMRLMGVHDSSISTR